MNVARKSTTKLPQNWQRVQNIQAKEEVCNRTGSTDSADSFQDALFNLKALSGNSDITESDRSELKEMQTNCTTEKGENEKKKDAASPSKENGGEKDILDQIDDIVNDKETPEELAVGNGINQSHGSTEDVKSDRGSDEDDYVLIIHEDNSNDMCKQSKGNSLQKDVGDLILKNKTICGTSNKNPLKIGEKVRSTVHSIMSKLVQSNPDVNSLLSKAKSEDSVDSGGSNVASPLPTRQDKGNLFDNFDIAERENKSPHVGDADDRNSGSPQQISSTDADEKLREDSSLENTEGTKNGVAGCDNEASESGELPAQKESSQSSIEETETVTSVKNQESDHPELIKVNSDEKNVDTKLPEEAVSKPPCESDSGALSLVPKETDAQDGGEGADSVTATESDLTDCKTKEEPTSPAQQSSDSKNAGSTLTESKAGDAEPMETTESKQCGELTQKVADCDSDTLRDKQSDTDRKRQHQSSSPKCDSDSDSQPPKRSRLDEVIGKLGERVPFPSDIPENDSFDYEDSTPGDTESVEKQSEEISGSTSDEEEEKTPDSKSDSKPKMLKLTKQELEVLVVAAAKTAIEHYQSSEILALNRRIEELKESQEEWRQKAKDLERQVLDLTVLQQKLEKRKAHTAALKSITTRSIGIWVTEDKLKTNTPQKNHPGNKSPPSAGMVPSTPPATTVPGLMWTSPSQSSGRMFTTVPASSLTTVTQSIPSRNTSVAHLLSQTARMPTVASCAAANRPVPAKSATSTPRPPVSMATLPVNQASSASTVKGPNSSAVPTTSLVLVNTAQSVPLGSKVVSQVSTAQQGVPAGSTQVRFIDLTMEDESGATKQTGKQVVGSGPVRNMVPQQVVRQITPLSQSMPGVPSSAILLSSPAGTQVVNTGNMPRPGMVQVVTIANAQALRPGSLVTVVPGQTNALVRHPATTLTTNARDSAPRLMTQQLPAGVTLVRPPPLVGSTSGVRQTVTLSSAGPTAVAPNARLPVTVTTQPSATAVQQDTASSASAPAASKKNPHIAPLPPNINPKGLPADVKPPPPKPGLKISRVKQGIVLSWNMNLPNDCVEIASYQLYAYQETSAAPQTSLWKKVGDVKALPLPMACTLTQFQDGNKYHFAVRAIDIHGRSGLFSDPSFIFLTKAS